MEFEFKKLGEICTRITDGSHYSPQEVTGGIPMYSVKDMTEYGFSDKSVKRISEADYEALVKADCTPRVKDVLIAKDGSVLKHVFSIDSEVKGALLSSIAILRPNPKYVESDFLAYALQDPQLRNDVLSNYVSGSGVPRIVLRDFKNISVRIPSLGIQKGIAQALKSLDKKIQVNIALSKTLEEIAQTLFRSWFVDFDPVRAKMAGQKPVGMDDATAALFPDSMDDSELGDIPAGWKLGTLGDVIEIHDSRRVPLSSDQRRARSGIYPYYGATGIVDYIDGFLFSGPHVLVGEDGTVMTDDGKPIVQYVWRDFWVNNHAHVLSGRGAFSVEYVKTLIEQLDIRTFITGAVQLKLNQANLKSVPVTLPPQDILQAFDYLCLPLFTLYRELHDQIATLTGIRDSLLPRLISGELQVPEDVVA